jgi:DNA gyrase inhibitor GyrI
MNLTDNPEIITWPETHYVFIEKIGPFQQTAPQAWATLHKSVPELLQSAKITSFMSLYKFDPNLMIYRAGAVVTSAPKALPEGFEYTKFKGGKYSRFVLKGSYANLPKASGRVFEIVAEKKISRRDDFCIEHYVNDPKTTPEDQLITEILIPTH